MIYTSNRVTFVQPLAFNSAGSRRNTRVYRQSRASPVNAFSSSLRPRDSRFRSRHHVSLWPNQSTRVLRNLVRNWVCPSSKRIEHESIRKSKREAVLRDERGGNVGRLLHRELNWAASSCDGDAVARPAHSEVSRASNDLRVSNGES